MATDKNPRTGQNEQASDQESVEETLSDTEETLAVPEAGTSAAGSVPVEEMTEEEFLRRAWQGSRSEERRVGKEC